MKYLLALVLSCLAAAPCLGEPVATFTPENSGGIRLLDVQDGHWIVSKVQDRDAVTLLKGTNPPSSYLYFALDSGVRDRVGSDLYLLIDFYDGDMGSASVQYNSAGDPYAPGPSFMTVPSKTWRQELLHITGADFGGLQNGGADLRIAGNVAIAKVEVYKDKPDVSLASSKERLKQYLGDNPRRTDMFYTFGNDADETQALLFKSLGVTSVESYVTWETVEGADYGKWDWSKWDKQVAILKEAGLKWVPFLILSPAYSTPGWFRASSEHVPCRCLEHGIDSKIESVWNPNLPKWIDRFIGEFAKRYKDSGVIESVLLGIQGDFGEAIYSVSGGGWTFNVPGEYHNHAGFWCGDPYAKTSFQQFVTKRYKTVQALNKAWGTDFIALEDVDVPGRGEQFQQFRAALPTATAGTKREWLDFVDWYRASMTDWSDWWMGITRKHFPEIPIYLCTGGDAPPEHGSNFAEQCRVSAKHNGGVRITNEASDYASNFMVTRWVASAGKHYGAYFGFEPAGAEDVRGIVARIYNATASGANQLHDYNPNVINSGETMAQQRAHFQYLFKTKPVVPVALWYPNVDLTLHWGGFLEKSARLRDYIDHDFVDESMLHTNALDKNKILLILHGQTMEPSDAKQIAAWAKKGGRIIVMDVPKLTSVGGAPEPEQILFGGKPSGRALGAGSIVRVKGWDGLTAQLTKTMQQLGLSFAQLTADRVYSTQIGPSRFLFYNATDRDETINLTLRGKTTKPVTAKAGTITDVKL